MNKIIPTLAVALIMASCASVNKMIDRGNYDGALRKSVKKLGGKSKLKQNHVLALEKAFARATERDVDQAKRLSTSTRSADWSRIIQIYDRIISRQRVVKPLLPIQSKDGYRANFRFAEVGPLRKEAIQMYLDLVYQDVTYKMELARGGSKQAAREAYHEIEKLWKYARDYRRSGTLRKEARELGINHIHVSLTNQMQMDLSPSLQWDLLNRSFPSKKWIKYHLDNNPNQAIDHELTLVLEEIDFSPERMSERFYTDEREIKVGFDYVLDERGNVMKDTAGNDIKVPKYEVIRADVVSVHQHKAASLSGLVVIRNTRTRKVKQYPIQSNIVFEHVGATFRGDERALSDETRDLLQALPIPFPSNRVLLKDAIAGLDEIIQKDVLKRIPM